MTIRAAGILYISKNGLALLMKRGPGGDHAGQWALPGGRVEDGETIEQAALREWEEETGVPIDGKITLWARRKERDQRSPFGYSESTEHVPMPGGSPVGEGQPIDADPQATARMEPPASQSVPEDVDFTTFIVRGGEEFIPTLCDESTGYAWAKPDLPPDPLHLGCRTALAKLTFNELDIAKAVAEGELTSPQRYENIALFDVRITGTGTAFRSKLNELAFRDPANYLTPEFLARCNGLPVIMEHPKNRSILNTKEFADRIVGTILLAYIKEQEVWGIAKIYDMAAAQMMEDEQLSTSPSVKLPPGDSTVLKMDDGKTILVEGDPVLIDHLAICEQGVWDKGSDPVGIVKSDDDIPMKTNSIVTINRAKLDVAVAKSQAIMIDAFCARMSR